MEYQKNKKYIKALSKIGLSDGTLGRITGVSITVIRSILYTNNYQPSNRTVERINNHMKDFLSIFSSPEELTK